GVRRGARVAVVRVPDRRRSRRRAGGGLGVAARRGPAQIPGGADHRGAGAVSAVKSTAPDPEGEPMSEAETAVVRIPTPLRAYAGGRSEVGVSGGTVAAALQDLTSRYPQLRRHLYDDRGRLRG